MGQAPINPVNRTLNRASLYHQTKTITALTRLWILTVALAGVTFSFPALAVDCRICGQPTNEVRQCSNSSCLNSANQINTMTDPPACLAPLATSSQRNPQPFQETSNSELNDDNNAPLWLLEISRQAVRDESNSPNIRAFLPTNNNIAPFFRFRDVDDAVDILICLLTEGAQHFIISNSFSIGENTTEYHLAVAVDDTGDIYVMSDAESDWHYVTTADIDEIMSVLGLSDENFDPSEEAMTVNCIAILQPTRWLDPIIEEDESALSE